MRLSVAPLIQMAFVLALPVTLAALPAEGVIRTAAFGHVPTASIINAIVGSGGRLLSVEPGGAVVAVGEESRIAAALLPLGVVPLPAVASNACLPKKG